jgi:outer membrane protein TolC
VDLRGSLTNARRKALAAYERSGIYHRSVRTGLIASIARAYYTLQMLDAKLAISRQTADSWKENVRIMRAMKEAGMTNEASVAQTEANALSIEASLFDLEYQARQVENSLCLLLGETPHKVERSAFDPSVFTLDLQTGMPAELLARRPDVQMAEQDLRMAFYDTQIARAAFYPALRLNGAYGWEKALTSPAGLLLSLGASVAEPLLDGGRRRADLTIARARQEEAAIAFHDCLMAAGAEVNDAVAKCLAAQGKTDLRIRQIADLRSAVASTQQLMHNSGATYLEVLTAQQSLLSAELLQVNDRYDYIDGLISLYRALGGGE